MLLLYSFDDGSCLDISIKSFNAQGKLDARLAEALVIGKLRNRIVNKSMSSKLHTVIDRHTMYVKVLPDPVPQPSIKCLSHKFLYAFLLLQNVATD